MAVVDVKDFGKSKSWNNNCVIKRWFILSVIIRQLVLVSLSNNEEW